jgi:hypothetical protein
MWMRKPLAKALAPFNCERVWGTAALEQRWESSSWGLEPLS